MGEVKQSIDRIMTECFTDGSENRLVNITDFRGQPVSRLVSLCGWQLFDETRPATDFSFPTWHSLSRTDHACGTLRFLSHCAGGVAHRPIAEIVVYLRAVLCRVAVLARRKVSARRLGSRDPRSRRMGKPAGKFNHLSSSRRTLVNKSTLVGRRVVRTRGIRPLGDFANPVMGALSPSSGTRRMQPG